MLSNVYISSSCVKTHSITKAVETLVQMGFKNIELSGGTEYDALIQDTLLNLKAKYKVEFLCHNYFPTPLTPFVVNLAAQDEPTRVATKNLLHQALALSSQLGANKYAFHAGFQINIPLTEVGKPIQKQTLWNENDCFNTFCEEYRDLMLHNKNKVQIYIENNVLAGFNYQAFNRQNPFFMTDYKGYTRFKKTIPCMPLLDVAHLKVSALTLNLNLEEEMALFMNETDYIHISDNDGLADTNGPLKENSKLFDQLSVFSLKEKTVTLEVYSSLKDVELSYQAVEKLMK